MQELVAKLESRKLVFCVSLKCLNERDCRSATGNIASFLDETKSGRYLPECPIYYNTANTSKTEANSPLNANLAKLIQNRLQVGKWRNFCESKSKQVAH